MIVRLRFPMYEAELDAGRWSVTVDPPNPALASYFREILARIAPVGAMPSGIEHFPLPELAQAAAAAELLGGEIVETIEQEGDEPEDDRVY